jgi:hypothetical protein
VKINTFFRPKRCHTLRVIIHSILTTKLAYNKGNSVYTMDSLQMYVHYNIQYSWILGNATDVSPTPIHSKSQGLKSLKPAIRMVKHVTLPHTTPINK